MTELDHERCVTCSDDAVEAQVVTVQGSEAIVRVAAQRESVAIDLVPDAAPGDLLLCHAGIALERVEPERERTPVAPSHDDRAAP